MILLTFCYFIAFKLLAKLYFAQLLLLVAVVATHDAEHLVYGVEEGLHRLVVGDALRVVAFHDALQCIWSLYGLLLYDFVVLDDTQSDVRSHHGEAVDFFIGEILVGNLDDALLANLLGWQVVADGDRILHLLQLEEVYYLIGLFGWYMVDYGTVLDSRNH